MRFEPKAVTILDLDGFHVGQQVRVKGNAIVARIERFYFDAFPGAILDRRIGRFYSWNLSDLEAV